MTTIRKLYENPLGLYSKPTKEREYRKLPDGRTQVDMTDEIVGKTTIDKYLVSTVLLWHYLNDDYEEVPQWETMIFAKENETVNYEDVYCMRHPTLKKAIEGHAEAVLSVMNETVVRKPNGYLEWNFDEEVVSKEL
jgi:hypothetical protein